MGLLDRAKEIIKGESGRKKVLIILFLGNNSLLLKSILEEFSNQLEIDKPNLNAHLLNLDDDFAPLKHLLDQILRTTYNNEKESARTIMVWPALLLPGTFPKYELEALTKDYKELTDIHLLEPLDFAKDIYPFLLKSMKDKFYT